MPLRLEPLQRSWVLVGQQPGACVRLNFEDRRGILIKKMNGITNTNSVGGAFAPAETSTTDFETQKTAKTLEDATNFASVRPLCRYSAGILQGIAWVFVALYLIGAIALGCAILYFTFVR